MIDTNLVVLEGVVERAWPGRPWAGIIKSTDEQRRHYVKVKTFNERANDLAPGIHVRVIGKLNVWKKEDNTTETYVFATMIEIPGADSSRGRDRDRGSEREGGRAGRGGASHRRQSNEEFSDDDSDVDSDGHNRR